MSAIGRNCQLAQKLSAELAQQHWQQLSAGTTSGQQLPAATTAGPTIVSWHSSWGNNCQLEQQLGQPIVSWHNIWAAIASCHNSWANNCQLAQQLGQQLSAGTTAGAASPVRHSDIFMNFNGAATVPSSESFYAAGDMIGDASGDLVGGGRRTEHEGKKRWS